jgi:hypothetical protein
MAAEHYTNVTFSCFRRYAKFDAMPSPEFERLMNECETVAGELKNCTNPAKRRELLKQMKVALDAANKVAFEPPLNGHTT